MNNGYSKAGTKKRPLILPSVFNKPINPESDPDFKTRKTKPVTPEEMGGYYLTAGMRNIQQKNGVIDLELLKKDLDCWHNPNLKPGESSPDLLHHNFGQGLWLNLSFLKARNWKEAMEEINKRGLYVYDCWGSVPGCRDSKDGGFTLTIPDETQEFMTKTLGKHFFGWDNGENDGRWFWQVMRVSPAPVDRKAAHQYFLGWFQPHFASQQNYVNSLCGLLFPHYFAKMEGQRLIGAEFIQALPSATMWSAWVRGAARQYQMLWFSGTSIWTNFGYKSFESDGFRVLNYWTDLDLGIGFPGAQGGPDRGPSLSLVRRVWYALYMYGTNIETIETSQLYRPAGPIQPSTPQADRTKEDLVAPEAKKEFLSPLGKVQLAASEFCHRYEKRRGIQYCPVAAFLDFYAGWNPPRHCYTDSFYVVWGGMPYEAGDHQVDLFFREIFPGYQDCNFFRNEKGILTQTPHGDIVDVLLSDCRLEILKRYRVVFALGEIKIEGGTFEKLKEYVKQGGRVIWSLNQLGPEALKFCGITPLGKKVKAKDSRNKNTGRKYREKIFNLPAVELSGGEVLLETKTKLPVVVRKKIGPGEVITILPDFGLGERVKEAHPLLGADPEFDTNTYSFFDKPIGSPYRFLEGVRDVIFPYLAQLNLVEVIASRDPFEVAGNAVRPVFIQYLTNVTERENKLVVTLINNEPLVTYVRLKARGGRITEAIDLLHNENKLATEDGTVEVTLFPSDNADFNIYIIELETDRPVVRFMEEA